MGRRVPKKEKPDLRLMRTARVRHVAVETRALLTIGEDSIVWREPNSFPDFPEGTVVRLKAPPDATEEKIDRVKRQLRDLGAEGDIRVSRRRRIALPEEALARARARKRSRREVVLEVARAGSFPDKDALAKRLEEIMSEAGL